MTDFYVVNIHRVHLYYILVDRWSRNTFTYINTQTKKEKYTHVTNKNKHTIQRLQWIK